MRGMEKGGGVDRGRVERKLGGGTAHKERLQGVQGQQPPSKCTRRHLTRVIITCTNAKVWGEGGRGPAGIIHADQSGKERHCDLPTIAPVPKVGREEVGERIGGLGGRGPTVYGISLHSCFTVCMQEGRGKFNYHFETT